MAVETTYSNLRQNLASVMNQVVDDQEVVIVRRRGARDVAMLPASELNSLLETAYLLRFAEERFPPAHGPAARRARGGQTPQPRSTAARGKA